MAPRSDVRSPALSAQTPVQQPRQSSPRGPAPVPDGPRAEESFRVRCFRYGRVFAALSPDAWPMRRLLVDVAWALNGFERAERRDFVFDWPQPGAVADGGGKAFGAFVRHQTRTREGVRVIVSGTHVATLLGPAAPNDSCILDGRLYVQPDGLDAGGKRRLWRLIQELDGSA